MHQSKVVQSLPVMKCHTKAIQSTTAQNTIPRDLPKEGMLCGLRARDMYDSGMDVRLSCYKLSIIITEQWLNNATQRTATTS